MLLAKPVICFQAGDCKRRLNLALVFCVFILCYSIFCYRCMFAFVVLDLVFSTKPRDWLGRTSPKWPILCGVGYKTLTQSINGVCAAVVVLTCSVWIDVMWGFCATARDNWSASWISREAVLSRPDGEMSSCVLFTRRREADTFTPSGFICHFW